MSESKRDKFVRLASMRGNRILKDLELIKNLSNTANYDYTEKDVEKLFKVIDAQVKISRNSFISKSSKKVIFD